MSRVFETVNKSIGKTTRACQNYSNGKFRVTLLAYRNGVRAYISNEENKTGISMPLESFKEIVRSSDQLIQCSQNLDPRMENYQQKKQTVKRKMDGSEKENMPPTKKRRVDSIDLCDQLIQCSQNLNPRMENYQNKKQSVKREMDGEKERENMPPTKTSKEDGTGLKYKFIVRDNKWVMRPSSPTQPCFTQPLMSTQSTLGQTQISSESCFTQPLMPTQSTLGQTQISSEPCFTQPLMPTQSTLGQTQISSEPCFTQPIPIVQSACRNVFDMFEQLTSLSTQETINDSTSSLDLLFNDIDWSQWN